MLRTLSLLAISVLASGCAASRVPPSPTTLAESNALLDGRHAQVVLVDGQRIHAEVVELATGQTTLRDRETGRARTLPTDSIATVKVRATSRVTKNALSGALPGLAITTAGTGRLVAGDLFGGMDWLLTGLALAITGSLGGAVLGDLEAARQWTVVYRLSSTAALQPVP